MTDSQIRLRWPAVLLGCASLLAGGAAAAYFLMNRSSSASDSPTSPASNLSAIAGSQPTLMPGPGEPLPDVALLLTPEGITGAGIVIGPASPGTVSSRVTLPATVEPNTYRQAAVTSLTAGLVTGVSVELGDQVERGQTLAQIFSPDLADAQTRFLSTQASLTGLQQQLQRTEKLMGIGAVSRQELERVRAGHTAATTELEAARSRLTLLGVTPEGLARISKGEVDGTTTVTAPSPGTVVQRDANAGQNVDGATRLFTIVDLSSVWIAGDLYEKDLSRVRLGSPAAITTSTDPPLTLSATVSYIDPQVNAATRTTRIRVEVQNPHGELQLGMRAELQIGEDGSAEVTLVPKEAVQRVGDRQVLYLANVGESGRFIEREVRLGEPVGDQVVVVSGVKPGDQLVVRGSAFLRSERERLGLRAALPGTL